MSQTTKIALGVVVAAIALLGAYFYWQKNLAERPPRNAAEVTSLPTGSSTSDTSLEEDLAAIDTQIQAAASDTSEANGSVNAAAAQ